MRYDNVVIVGFMSGKNTKQITEDHVTKLEKSIGGRIDPPAFIFSTKRHRSHKKMKRKYRAFVFSFNVTKYL